MKDLKNKVILISGASSGIGRASAFEFARAGCHTILCARRQGELDRVTEEIKRMGQRALAIQTDVSDSEQVARLAKKSFYEFGNVDIVFCNAGISLSGPTHKMVKADWERVMNVNFYGTIHLLEHFLPPMVDRHEGHIIINASVFGLSGIPYHSLYSTSKFALVGLGECLYGEMSQYNVGVTTLCPGFVKTEIFENAETKHVKEEARDLLKYLHPMSVEKLTKITVNAVKKNKGLLPISPLTHSYWGLKRISPKLAQMATKLIAKMSGRYISEQ